MEQEKSFEHNYSEFGPNAETKKSDVEIAYYISSDYIDEPYEDTAFEGFSIFNDFIHKLRGKYPNRHFPNDVTIENINPLTKGIQNLDTFAAYDKDESVGVVIGENVAGVFNGQWVIIDPSYQNSEVVKMLFEAVKSRYDSIKIIAHAIGEKSDLGPERLISRQNALVELYKRNGFRIDEKSKAYKYSLMPGGPVPMIWERKK